MWNNRATRVIILQSLEKRTLWKFWFNPRFSQNSKSKWTLKWLPLDRGYFEFYFRKRRRFTNNPMTYVFYFCRIVLSCVGIAMHLILVKISCNLVLLINNPSKRGDVETLARSSVFPSSQVKVKLKLTVSR